MKCPQCQQTMSLVQRLCEPNPVEFFWVCFDFKCADDTLHPWGHHQLDPDTVVAVRGAQAVMYEKVEGSKEPGGCRHCGSIPLALERGRCEECGCYQTETGELSDEWW